jgi:hypothetical protein
MIQKISKTQEIKEQLKREGKHSFLDQPQHVEAIAAMNEQLEAVRREYQVKERNSQITAAEVILNS